MKKSLQFISRFSAILFFVLLIIPEVYTQQTYSLGDVNTDGVINIVDALKIAQYDAGLGNLEVAYADVNMDGTISIVDGLLVARYAEGIITELPAPSPPPLEGTPMPGAGEVIFSPDSYETTIIFSPKDQTRPKIRNTITSQIMVNTGAQKLAAYSMDIIYDWNLFYKDDSVGSAGIIAGEDGFVTVVNGSGAEGYSITGFEEYGIGPGDALHLIDINLIPIAEGTNSIRIKIYNLVDEYTRTVGTPVAGTFDVNIDRCTMGDVNDDGEVDIVDALSVAQYYVGINPTLYKFICGDVDMDGYLTIIDALLIAQYYVGLLDDFNYNQ